MGFISHEITKSRKLFRTSCTRKISCFRVFVAKAAAVASVVCAIVATPAFPRAQQPSSPVFRSGTELVLVNVVVRDKTGAVVRNLTRDDFLVTEDDRPQTIS